MKIRILTSLVTCSENAASRAYNAGDEVTWADKADAQKLIRAGYAEAVETETPKGK